MFANNTVQEVSYNVFLDELEAKNIDQVPVSYTHLSEESTVGYLSYVIGFLTWHRDPV